jgi:uncharacterized membrane protein
VTATLAPTGVRLPALDLLRGVAVLLMVADHVLYAAGLHVWRLGPTRIALPLFALLAGALFRPGLARRRLVELAVAAILLAPPLEHLLGMPTPGILAVLLWCVLILQLVDLDSRPTVLAVLTVAVLQPVTWPMVLWFPTWNGYEPGTVLALMLVGQLARPYLAQLESRSRAAASSIERIGRYPLTLYVGHLLVLVVLTTVV